MKKERERRKEGGRQGEKEERKEEKEKSLLRKTILKSGGDTFHSLNDLILFYQQRLEGLEFFCPCLLSPVDTGRGKSRFTIVSIKNTEFIPVSLFISYYISFHGDNYKSTFAPSICKRCKNFLQQFS